jgi:hypothetical protein
LSPNTGQQHQKSDDPKNDVEAEDQIFDPARNAGCATQFRIITMSRMLKRSLMAFED